jgi:hypothetical protein
VALSLEEVAELEKFLKLLKDRLAGAMSGADNQTVTTEEDEPTARAGVA